MNRMIPGGSTGVGWGEGVKVSVGKATVSEGIKVRVAVGLSTAGLPEINEGVVIWSASPALGPVPEVAFP
jgi:hypothetical protein